MEKIQFNQEWYVSGFKRKRLVDFLSSGGQEGKKVDLPHDAMIEEIRNCKTQNGGQTGFYPGGFYTYRKTFFVPPEWEGEKVMFEFEGVYMNAQVFINNRWACSHTDGYSGFYVDAEKLLDYGQENILEVQVNNACELNSRWYSGSGIYRNVNLWRGGVIHIPPEGVRITTENADEEYAVLNADIKVKNRDYRNHRLVVRTVLTYEEKQRWEQESELTIYAQEEESVRQRIEMKKPFLWNYDSPNLYQCEVTVWEEGKKIESWQANIGVRTIQLDFYRGLRINGREVKLRGACIHHDNGVIGSCTLEKAEYRRCRQLKEAGFNCIRSSHHPVSKAMLEACDRLGMLVMDELTDMWNSRKNQNDNAFSFGEHWEKELEAMVGKDYNHPSVILYSTGNEIPEAGSERGAYLNRKIVSSLRMLDSTRYITNAINGNIAIMDELGQALESIAQENGTTVQEIISGSFEKKDSGGGSNGLNALMSLLTGKMGDAVACHPIMTRRLREFVDTMDIAGYNYMTGRHEMEKQISHNRIVLGTETFPSEIVRLWDIVKNNANVIGDMTWTGYDYLGEAGLGVFYYDGTNNFAVSYPDRLAGCGDIDLIGRRKAVSYFRETVYGLRDIPYIAVERMDRCKGNLSTTPWAWKDAVASWTWPGYEDKVATVHVISDAEEVELFLNEQSLGRKKAGEKNGFLATYMVKYEPGTLKAVSYRQEGDITSSQLITAGKAEKIRVITEEECLHGDGRDLAFITIGFTDKDGNENIFEKKEVRVEVNGEGYLQGFGNANPRSEGSFQDTVWTTYDGYVMAVIRSGNKAGNVEISISSPGCEKRIIAIPVV